MALQSSSVKLCFGTLRAIRMSSTAAASRRLEGKVAIVTASTEGYNRFGWSESHKHMIRSIETPKP